MKKGLLTLALVLVASSSFAHFQMLYTPESALNTGQKIDLRLTFTHPFADEHTMEMGLQHDTKTPAAVEEFYVINKDKKKGSAQDSEADHLERQPQLCWWLRNYLQSQTDG